MGHVLVSLSNREEGPGRKTSSNEKLFSKHRWYWSQLQLCFVGHTIVGDYTYSHRQDTAPYRMMLHAYRLSLPLKPLIDCLDVCAPDPFITDDLWQTEVTHARLDDFDGISWTKFWSFSTRWIKEWENILLCHTAENKTSELFLLAPDNRIEIVIDGGQTTPRKNNCFVCTRSEDLSFCTTIRAQKSASKRLWFWDDDRHKKTCLSMMTSYCYYFGHDMSREHYSQLRTIWLSTED